MSEFELAMAKTMVNAHVEMGLSGYSYLGEVADAYAKDDKVFLKVYFFNGEEWPFDPEPRAVRILEREYEKEEA